MKMVYMGTPEFAVPCLEMLVKEGHEICGVVTQPDKPAGRGRKLLPPPVKSYALKNGLKVIQPDKIKNNNEFYGILKNISPEVIIVVAYGKILPLKILELPSFGCINVHASLLPLYRGCSPINSAIINGDKITGITAMYMNEGMDTGDILLKEEVGIPLDMTAGELHDLLMVRGAEVLKDTLEKLMEGNLKGTVQEHSKATYAPMLDRESGRIKWSSSALDIHNLVRGTNPWPGAYAYYRSERMKIWKTFVINSRGKFDKPGTILKIDRNGIETACGDGIIRILEIQMDNCKKLTIDQCWHNLDEGERLE